MSRVIKFRGIRVDGKGWAIGNYVYTKYNNIYKGIIGVQQEYSHQIYPINIDGHTHEVVPETLGQFTGLLDKKGKEIYEGDMIKYNSWTGNIEFNRGAFFIDYIDGTESELNEMNESDLEVIGNIHENKKEG